MITIDESRPDGRRRVPVEDLPRDFAHIAEVGDDYLTVLRKLGTGTRLLLRVLHDERGLVLSVWTNMDGGFNLERLTYDRAFWTLYLDGAPAAESALPPTVQDRKVDEKGRAIRFTTQ